MGTQCKTRSVVSVRSLEERKTVTTATNSHTWIGKDIKRREDPDLLTGRAEYTNDVKLPGMLHAAVLRSPHAHARIMSIDTTAAWHLPGVVSVITDDDLEGVVEPVPTRQDTEADALQPPVHPVLARGKVCYAGQPIAIIV